MPSTKRIMISLPSHLLAEVDDLISLENKNRSEFIRDAMKLYMTEKRRRDLREQMKTGYQAMAQINLTLAREGFILETEASKYFGEPLAECQ
ncbi:MAG: ribbon-helix-helix protein, CopG family [Bacillota bacterium]|nr:ribbon-helix-helix protein, CopG family [Bacillota bacterium]